MTGYRAALAVEFLKARRSMVPWVAAGVFSILPLIGGLFMVILKDPDRARQMGLLGQKAQLTAGTADWGSYFDLLCQGGAAMSIVVFALVTVWIFGREFSDRTVRTLLALPTPRWAIVAAKGTVVGGFGLLLSGWVLLLAVGVVNAVDIPGWTPGIVAERGWLLLRVLALTLALQTVTAWVASASRGYLGAVAFTFGVLGLGNVLGVLGWGAWFPWSIPILLSGAGGPEMGPVGTAGFLLVGVTALLGALATLAFWERADQSL